MKRIPMKNIMVAGIRFYRRWVSPFFPAACRFYPTCSAYAMEAVQQNGAMKGSIKAFLRILRCHPWHAGGYDPVSPQAKPECEGLRKKGEEAPKDLPSNSTAVNIINAPRALRPAPSKR